MTNVIIRSDEGLTLETSAFRFLYGGQFTLSTVLINQISMSSLLWRDIKILGSLSSHNNDGRNNVTSLHSQLAWTILVFAHNFRSCFHPFHDTEWPVLQLCGQNDQFWIFSQISKALSLPTQTYFWCHFKPQTTIYRDNKMFIIIYNNDIIFAIFPGPKIELGIEQYLKYGFIT